MIRTYTLDAAIIILAAFTLFGTKDTSICERVVALGLLGLILYGLHLLIRDSSRGKNTAGLVFTCKGCGRRVSVADFVDGVCPFCKREDTVKP